jgi:hypothetical protein
MENKAAIYSIMSSRLCEVFVDCHYVKSLYDDCQSVLSVPRLDVTTSSTPS